MYTSEAQVEGFIKEYTRSRVVAETSVRAILRRAIEWEKKFNKAFYDFDKEEALEMFKSAHAISVVSLQNANLTLKHASRYFQNKVGGNVYEGIGKYDLEECVDKNKKKNLIFTKEEIEDIQEQLVNDTDKSILFLLFEGAGGEKLKEIMFASIDQLSRKDMKMFFRSGKTIKLTPETYDLLRRGFLEDELVSFGETTRISRVIPSGLYKVRCNTLSDNSNIDNPEDRERRYRWCQRRMMLIADTLGIQITSGSVQESGLLHYLKQGVAESGLTFRDYVKTEEARALARHYDIYSEYAPQILLDKFQEHFQ